MSTELMQCPFCRSPGMHAGGGSSRQGRIPFRIDCANRLCNARSGPAGSKEEAAELWNRRAQKAQELLTAGEEILAVHHKLAAETLRADQGWARYKAANAARNKAEAALAEIQPQAFCRLLELIGRITSYRYGMSYNDSYFGEPAGQLKRTVRDIEKLLDRVRAASAPADVPPVAAKVATVHKRIDALCTAANTPGGDYFDAGTCLMLAVRELLVTLGYPHSFDIDAALAAKDKP